MIPARSTWGSNIRAARKARGLSQSELASRLRVTQASISQWEAGTTAPKDEHRSVLVTVLESDYLSLFPIEVSA